MQSMRMPMDQPVHNQPGFGMYPQQQSQPQELAHQQYGMGSSSQQLPSAMHAGQFGAPPRGQQHIGGQHGSGMGYANQQAGAGPHQARGSSYGGPARPFAGVPAPSDPGPAPSPARAMPPIAP